MIVKIRLAHNQATGLSWLYGQKRQVACTSDVSIIKLGFLRICYSTNCLDIWKNQSKFIFYLFFTYVSIICLLPDCSVLILSLLTSIYPSLGWQESKAYFIFMIYCCRTPWLIYFCMGKSLKVLGCAAALLPMSKNNK